MLAHFFIVLLVLLVRISDVSIGRPLVPDKDKTAKERRVFPSEVSFEFPFPLSNLSSRAHSFPPFFLFLLSARFFRVQARERLTTYKSKMTARIRWSVNEGPEHEETRELGYLPVMVRVSLRLPFPSSASVYSLLDDLAFKS